MKHIWLALLLAGCGPALEPPAPEPPKDIVITDFMYADLELKQVTAEEWWATLSTLPLPAPGLQQDGITWIEYNGMYFVTYKVKP